MNPIMQALVSNWVATASVRPCIACGEVCRPTQTGRCAWCQYRHDHPDWVCP